MSSQKIPSFVRKFQKLEYLEFSSFVGFFQKKVTLLLVFAKFFKKKYEICKI